MEHADFKAEKSWDLCVDGPGLLQWCLRHSAYRHIDESFQGRRAGRLQLGDHRSENLGHGGKSGRDHRGVDPDPQASLCQAIRVALLPVEQKREQQTGVCGA